jgi:hypothetical protein
MIITFSHIDHLTLSTNGAHDVLNNRRASTIPVRLANVTATPTILVFLPTIPSRRSLESAFASLASAIVPATAAVSAFTIHTFAIIPAEEERRRERIFCARIGVVVMVIVGFWAVIGVQSYRDHRHDHFHLSPD